MTPARRYRLARTLAATGVAVVALLGWRAAGGSSGPHLPGTSSVVEAGPFGGHLLVEGIHGFTAAEVAAVDKSLGRPSLSVAVGEVYVRRGSSAYSRYPLAAVAVQADAYAEAAGHPELAAALARGVVLSATTARLFGWTAGSTLTLGAGTARVSAVIEDRLLEGYQLLMRQGWPGSPPRRADFLIVAARHASPVEAKIQAALPDRRLRFVLPSAERSFSPSANVLSQSQLGVRLGVFGLRDSGSRLVPDPAWVARMITTARVPLLGNVTCNRKILPDLVAALDELESAGLGSLLDRADFKRQGGCWNPRLSRRDNGMLSHHLWGIALDINVAQNPLGAVPHQDARLVAVFERHHFTWGGRWLRHDGAHFEWTGA